MNVMYVAPNLEPKSLAGYLFLVTLQLSDLE